MKNKLFLTATCLAFCVKSVYAQDIIMKLDKEEIKAKILEVSTGVVKYRKFGYATETLFNINTSEVLMITYEDKSKDVFKKDPVTGIITVEHISPPPSPPPAPIVSTSPEQTNSTHQANPVKPVSNGTFEMLAFDNGNVSFRAVAETPVYSVSQISGSGDTVIALTIENIRGDILRSNGIAAKEGSALALNKTGIRMLKNTEVQCPFSNIPAGFVPATIMFLTGKDAAPMSYDLVAGVWIKSESIAQLPVAGQPEPPVAGKPEPPVAGKPKPPVVKQPDPPVVKQPDPPIQGPEELGPVIPYKVSIPGTAGTTGKTVTAIKFPGGNCKLKKVNVTTKFPFFTDKNNNNFDIELAYTIENANGKKNSELLSVLYDQGRFMAPDGTRYKAKAAFIPDKGSTYYLIASIPKNVAVMTLKFVFDKQILEL
jgi:hypothetical protein